MSGRVTEANVKEYFVDGITDDLTTDPSRISESFVIARNTAFTYKGQPVDVKQIGRELGVRYVLEGSVRRTGHQVRVNVQLVDAETGAHLWADRFDSNPSLSSGESCANPTFVGRILSMDVADFTESVGISQGYTVLDLLAAAQLVNRERDGSNASQWLA